MSFIFKHLPFSMARNTSVSAHLLFAFDTLPFILQTVQKSFTILYNNGIVVDSLKQLLFYHVIKKCLYTRYR